MIDIFISHSAKDEGIAVALIELLRTALTLRADQIRCTSVNGYRLSAGANTNDQLRQEVHEAKIFIGLITQESLQSAYVLFELGARWGAGRPLVPLLAAGTPPHALVGPLAVLNALSCDSDHQIHQLVNDLAQELNASPGSTSSFLCQIQNLIRASSNRVLTGAPLVMIWDPVVCGEMLINQKNFSMLLMPVTILNESPNAITPEYFSLSANIEGTAIPFIQMAIPPNARFLSEQQTINIDNPHEWDLLRRIGSLLPGAAATGLLMFISESVSYRKVQGVIVQKNLEISVQCTDVRGFTHTVLPRRQPPGVPGAAFRVGMVVSPRSNPTQTEPP